MSEKLLGFQPKSTERTYKQVPRGARLQQGMNFLFNDSRARNHHQDPTPNTGSGLPDGVTEDEAMRALRELFGEAANQWGKEDPRILHDNATVGNPPPEKQPPSPEEPPAE